MREPTVRTAARPAALLAVLTGGLLLGSATAVPASGAAASVATTSVTASAAPEVYAVPDAFDKLVLKWTNVARKNHHRAPLRMVPCLDGFAERWTRHMAATDVFEHQALGPMLSKCKKGTVGENIAYGTGKLGARRVVSLWMHSAGHRRNILDPDFTTIGIAAWRSADTGRKYVTQDFGG